VATVLGLLGFALFVVAVISLAAGVSWLVVRLTPSPRSERPQQDT
jgi:hypothetical protein